MEQIAGGAGANGGRQHTAYEHVPLFMYGGICHRTGRNFCLAEMYHMWAWGFASRCTWNKILETLSGKARWCHAMAAATEKKRNRSDQGANSGESKLDDSATPCRRRLHQFVPRTSQRKFPSPCAIYLGQMKITCGLVENPAKPRERGMCVSTMLTATVSAFAPRNLLFNAL